MYNYSQESSLLLKTVAEELDIPESYFDLAVKRYESIGAWLERKESKVAHYSPLIYPQGSFLLGTVTKPISGAEEYDIDLVSELSLQKTEISQETLKYLIGYEIKLYARANHMNSLPEESRRCWTLNYADGAQFHADILPAIPDAEMFKQFLKSRGISPSSWSDFAIAITDNTLPNYSYVDSEWPRSNPRGYAEWFRSRMQTQYDAIRKSLIEKRVDEVPEYKIKTTLQQGIQILKRHRDIWFEENKSRYNEEAKPISIITTTLAALAYNNEADLQQALWSIASNMHKHIEDDNGVTLIRNPVNPLENFADKWQEHPIREICFRDWLKQMQADLKQAFELSDVQKVGESLKPCLGERVVNEGLKDLPAGRHRSVSPLAATVVPRKSYAR